MRSEETQEGTARSREVRRDRLIADAQQQAIAAAASAQAADERAAADARGAAPSAPAPAGEKAPSFQKRRAPRAAALPPRPTRTHGRDARAHGPRPCDAPL